MFHFSRNSIDVFGLSIHYYGILIALGVLLGVLLAARRQKRLNLPPETGLDLALICLPVAVVCARAYYVIFEWSAYKDDLLSIFNLRRGGLAIYGGVLGGALAVFVYSRIKKRPFLSLADLAAPSLALGQAVGRWGNFFNQEAYGAAVTQPSRMHFPWPCSSMRTRPGITPRSFTNPPGASSSWRFCCSLNGGVSSGKGATCFSGI